MQRRSAFDPGDPPPGWTNPHILAQPISLETTVLRALTFHGAMVLATKPPGLGPGAREIIQDMLDHLEAMFEGLGLESPLMVGGGEVF